MRGGARECRSPACGPRTVIPQAGVSAVLVSTYDFINFMKEGSIVPRRGNVPKREILPDPMYNSILVTKLVNSIMLDGKKGVAQKIVYHLDRLRRL